MRIWNDYGKLYVVRDLHNVPPPPSLQPQHLVVRGDVVVWMNHPEGGLCEPLCEIPPDRMRDEQKRT